MCGMCIQTANRLNNFSFSYDSALIPLIVIISILIASSSSLRTLHAGLKGRGAGHSVVRVSTETSPARHIKLSLPRKYHLSAGIQRTKIFSTLRLIFACIIVSFVRYFAISLSEVMANLHANRAIS